MKTLCLETNKMQHCCGKENTGEAGWVRKKGSANKKFNLCKKEKTCLRRVCKRSIKVDQNFQLILE